MGIFIIFLISGLSLGIFFSVKYDAFVPSLICLIFLPLLGAIIGTYNRTPIVDNYFDKQLVAVNGYYVDDNHNFITTDNMRGKDESCPVLLVSNNKVAPVLHLHHIVYKMSFLKLGEDSISYEVVYPENIIKINNL